MTKKSFDILKQLRSTILHTVEGLSIEQLNQIPDGFNNNIIWNLGHLPATDQRIFYVRSGLPPTIPEPFIQQYQKGTKPDAFVGSLEIEEVKEWLIKSMEQLESDYQKGLFKHYEEWTTSYGNTLSSIEDVIAFSPFHEGLHFGLIKVLIKKVS